MDNLDKVLSATAAKQMTTDDALQAIFMQYYADPREDESNTGYQAYKMAAVDASVRLMNLFIGIRRPQEPRTYRIACDLTFDFNTNIFWNKNSPYLVPLLHAALNTYADGAELQKQNAEGNTYAANDGLIASSRYLALEIFPLIAYILGGAVLMREVSLPLKRALSPYMV